MRSFGGSLNDLISAVGAQPVGLPFGEVYGALERGVVDCAITGTGSGNSAKWFEVATTMYVLPVAWSTGAYYANLPWWNKLDPATRGAIEAQFKAVEDGLWKMGADATDDGVQCNVGKRGWMDGVGGCANVGGICIGCTMPGFPDKFTPFMDEPPGAKLSTAAISIYGRTVHALRQFTKASHNKEPEWRGPQPDRRPQSS